VVEVLIEMIDVDQAEIEAVPPVIEEVPAEIIEVVVIEDPVVQTDADLGVIQEAEVQTDIREIEAVPPLIVEEV